MENNNHKKRKVMLIAAFAVAVIALAGVGYAATSYKATTVNSGNTAASNYIVVTQDGLYSADFSTAVEFNTYTDSTGSGDTKVIYTLTENTAVAGDYVGSKIGDVQLTITSPVTMTNYNLKAVKHSGTLADGWTYILKVKNTSNVLYYNAEGNVWAVNADGSGLDTITVTSGAILELYIASETTFANVSPAPTLTTLDGYAGYPASRTVPAGNILNNVTLLFEITGNESS